jgi:Carboxypeptidase regulatory-like domain
MRPFALFLLLAWAVLPILARAQTGNLTISGVVTDEQSRRPIINATVTVAGDLDKSPTMTDSAGSFVLELAKGVEAGSRILIRIEKPGYETYARNVSVSPTIPLQVPLVPIRAAKQEPRKSGGEETHATTPPNSTGPGSIQDGSSGTTDNVGAVPARHGTKDQPTVEVGHPNPTPERPPGVILTPAYGNLKLRCTKLSGQIAQLVGERNNMLNDEKIYPRPLTRERWQTWVRSNDGVFRGQLMAQVDAIHDELAELHIHDNDLDEILKRDRENDQFRQLSPGQLFYGMGWLSIFDIEKIGERLAALASQIPTAGVGEWPTFSPRNRDATPTAGAHGR